MQSPSPSGSLLLEEVASTEAWNRLGVEMTRLVVPLVKHWGGSVGGIPRKGKPLWWCDATGCACSQAGIVPTQCVNGLDRTCSRRMLIQEGRQLGEVLLCFPEASCAMLKPVEELVLSSVHTIELERSEVALLEELSRCLESLEAVSEISSSSRSIGNTAELLGRIMNRAVSTQSGLEAVLWIERGGMLEPAAINTKRHCEPRPRGTGLVGRSIADHRGVIINGRHRLDAVSDLEPELSGAQSVVIAPMATQSGAFGALAVWQEASDAPFDSRNMHLVETLAVQAAMIVENERLHREALGNELIRQELEIGSKMQQTLLTCQPPPGIQGLAVAATTIAARDIGGDFYDFFYHSGGSLDVVIGDVMGKGVPAALVGAGTKNQIMRALCFLLTYRGDKMPKIQEILALANKEIAAQLIGIDRFVTLCYARFDSTRRNLILVDCGHTRTVHYRASLKTVQMLQGENCPLGFRAKEQFQELVVPIEVGDILFFYSDGVTEAASDSGELFGEEGVARVIRENIGEDPATLIELIRASSEQFSGSLALADDLTCVAVKVTGGKSRLTPLHHAELRMNSDLASLSHLRVFLTRLAGALPDQACGPESLANFILAVNEAASNVMRHAYGGRAGMPLKLVGDIYDDYLQVELKHRGIAFKPKTGQGLGLQGPAEGGMGLYIIDQFSDGVSYYTDESGECCVRLVKQLASTQIGGLPR